VAYGEDLRFSFSQVGAGFMEKGKICINLSINLLKASKMKKKTLLGILACLFFSVASQAQIGYQVALLNSATGEPRANETVSAEVTITDSQNDVVCSETQSVTSNDFGILSFFISVTVDDVLIGKSQILSVPVAEVASTLKSDFTLDELCQTWKVYERKPEGYLTFYKNGSCSYRAYYSGELSEKDSGEGTYEIEGNNIYVWVDGHTYVTTWRFKNGNIFQIGKL